MLLISGDHSDYHLIEKMNAREDKYIISQIVLLRRTGTHQSGDHKYDSVIVEYAGAWAKTISSNIVSARISDIQRRKYQTFCFASSVELNLFDSPLLLSRNNQGLQIEAGNYETDLASSDHSSESLSRFRFFRLICIKMTDGGLIVLQQTRLTKLERNSRYINFTMVNAKRWKGTAGKREIEDAADRTECCGQP